MGEIVRDLSFRDGLVNDLNIGIGVKIAGQSIIESRSADIDRGTRVHTNQLIRVGSRDTTDAIVESIPMRSAPRTESADECWLAQSRNYIKQ